MTAGSESARVVLLVASNLTLALPDVLGHAPTLALLTDLGNDIL